MARVETQAGVVIDLIAIWLASEIDVKCQHENQSMIITFLNNYFIMVYMGDIEMAVSIMKGSYTVELANKLGEQLDSKYSVYCSHKGRRDGYITASFYNEKNISNRLSFVDILITQKYNSGEEKPVTLIEFEETNDSPKTIIGDIYSLLFGDGSFSAQIKVTNR